MNGKYVSIKYYEIHDGDGIRTTVFLKGCPLHCKWCHNPECISFKDEIGFYSEKCKNCGLCSIVCPSKAHTMENGVHQFNREKCIQCGKCADVCTNKALSFYGKDISSDNLINLICKDEMFFKSMGGGVTISGGEPLAQPEFTIELAKKIKERGIDVAIDTTLYTTKEIIQKLAPFVDTFLVDAKAAYSSTHKELTGVDNEIIYENIAFLYSLNCKMEIRVPFIPGCNSNEMEEIAKKLSAFGNITAVKVLPYHYYAMDKYKALGLPYSLVGTDAPTSEEIKKARDIFRKYNFLVLEE